ncbi:18576_t:CDS:2 [Entrophospora sp. SA101]|nr:13257_t:CDS:2 [Entrophospora sp. SA101]CAJ0763146.1 18576_t:CDS:2 [Entrophospora sp. SA101]
MQSSDFIQHMHCIWMTNQGIYLLVDEYDAFSNEYLDLNDGSTWNESQSLLKGFWAQAKACMTTNEINVLKALWVPMMCGSEETKYLQCIHEREIPPDHPSNSESFKLDKDITRSRSAWLSFVLHVGTVLDHYKLNVDDVVKALQQVVSTGDILVLLGYYRHLVSEHDVVMISLDAVGKQSENGSCNVMGLLINSTNAGQARNHSTPQNTQGYQLSGSYHQLMQDLGMVIG